MQVDRNIFRNSRFEAPGSGVPQDVSVTGDGISLSTGEDVTGNSVLRISGEAGKRGGVSFQLPEAIGPECTLVVEARRVSGKVPNNTVTSRGGDRVLIPENASDRWVTYGLKLPVPEGTFTNYFTNPEFERTGANVEIRRNYSVNPSMLDSAFGWTTTGSVASITATGEGVRVRLDRAREGVTTEALLFQSVEITATGGDRWSSSIEVTVPSGSPAVSLYLRVYSYGENRPVSASADIKNILPGETVTLVADSSEELANNTTGVRSILYGSSVPEGAVFIAKNSLLEKASSVGPYFDGDNQPRIRENLAPEHDLAFNNNGGSHQAITTSEIPPGNPDGLTSARQVWLRANANTRVLVSLYGLGGTGNEPNLPRYVGFWVYIDSDFSDYLIPEGSMFSRRDVPSREWVWVASDKPRAGWMSLEIQRPSALRPSASDRAYINGITVETVPVESAFSGDFGAPQGYKTAWEGRPRESTSYMYDGDFEVSWTGAAGASESILTGKSVAGLSATATTRAVQSSHYLGTGGSSSVRLVRYPLRDSVAASQTYAQFTFPTQAMDGTFIGTLHAPKPVFVTPTAFRHCLYVRRPESYTRYSSPAGTFQHRLKYEVEDSRQARVYGDGPLSDHDVWWTDVLLTDGEYAGPFFSGDTPGATWAGTPHASTSQWTPSETDFVEIEFDAANTDYEIEFRVLTVVPSNSYEGPAFTGDSVDAIWEDTPGHSVALRNSNQTSPESWWVDNKPLQNYAHNITTLGDDRASAPTIRNSSVTVPFRPGSEWLPGVVDAKPLQLGMWLQGSEADGSVPTRASSRVKFFDNLRKMQRELWNPRKLSELTKKIWVDTEELERANYPMHRTFTTYGMSLLTVKSPEVSFLRGLTPSMTGGARAAMVLEYMMHDPFFYAPVQDIPLQSTNTIYVPGDERTYRVSFTIKPTASRNNIRIVNTTSGVEFTVTGNYPSGSTTVIDSYTFDATYNGSHIENRITHKGDRFWFYLEPGENVINSSVGSGQVVMHVESAWF